MVWRFWTRKQQRSAQVWIDEVLDEENLSNLKPLVEGVLERFCNARARIPNNEKQAYLAAAIIIASKFEEDEAWLDPSDMLEYYAGPMRLEDYKKQLIRLEREVLRVIQWKITK